MSTHGSLSEVERFNLLYKSSFNKVCNFACFYVRNKQASEDITMDAFLQLLETMKVESVDNPMALLITIVKHKSLDYLKTQVRREDTKDDLIQWKQRELAIRISNLEGCNPSYIFSQEIKSIVMKTACTGFSISGLCSPHVSPQFCLLKVQEFQPVVHRLRLSTWP